MKYTNSELKEIEALHIKWLNKEDGGVRADFSGQDLSYMKFIYMKFIDAIFSNDNCTFADLRNVDFKDAKLRHVDFSREGE